MSDADEIVNFVVEKDGVVQRHGTCRRSDAAIQASEPGESAMECEEAVVLGIMAWAQSRVRPLRNGDAIQNEGAVAAPPPYSVDKIGAEAKLVLHEAYAVDEHGVARVKEPKA